MPADVKARIGTHLFSVTTGDIKKAVRFLTEVKNYYVDVSDQGNARFSKSAASAFATYVRNAFITGKYEQQVPVLSSAYAKRKQGQYPGKPKGMRKDDMVNAITFFRSRVGGDSTRHGHVVGIDPSHHRKDSPLHLRLEGFTQGYMNRPQPPRPIFMLAFQDFMIDQFPGILGPFMPDMVIDDNFQIISGFRRR
ncbi:MAG: hypothetical protein ACOCZ4_00345 [Bacteroidota bacterium]